MAVTEKAVVRYEAVCDFCREYLGEFSSNAEAWAEIHRHVNEDHHNPVNP